MCKYLILGNGFVGQHFSVFLEGAVVGDVRIGSVEDVRRMIGVHQPEWVINCIGKTGTPNIDWCETHKAETLFSNTTVPLMIFAACLESRVKLLHMGTGCIYEGDNEGAGFSEEDEPNFTGSFYSRTKLRTEKLLSEFDVLQLRVRMPIDSMPSPRNLITKLLAYDEVIDVPNSVTVINDFLQAARVLMNQNATGIYNVVNPDSITARDVLECYNNFASVPKSYKVVSLEELEKRIAARRSNCILSTEKISAAGIVMTPMKTALPALMQDYVA